MVDEGEDEEGLEGSDDDGGGWMPGVLGGGADACVSAEHHRMVDGCAGVVVGLLQPPGRPLRAGPCRAARRATRRRPKSRPGPPLHPHPLRQPAAARPGQAPYADRSAFPADAPPFPSAGTAPHPPPCAEDEGSDDDDEGEEGEDDDEDDSEEEDEAATEAEMQAKAIDRYKSVGWLVVGSGTGGVGWLAQGLLGVVKGRG